MTKGRIGKQDLEERLPAILKEQFKRDGLPADNLPSWNYITANTRYSATGLNNKCQEFYGQSLHDFLRDQGFGIRTTGKYPTDDEETIRSLDYFFEKIESNRGYVDSTNDGIRSVINKVYEAIEENDFDTEILYLGRYDSKAERIDDIQITVSILEYMDEQLADSTLTNYPRYFEYYYIIVKNRYQIDFNPVTEALDEFKWKRTYGDPNPLTENQLQDIWNTIDNLDECPIQGYDLDKWKMWMKVLIVFLIAVGVRANEVERFDLRTQLEFGSDPHVTFEERKNLHPMDAPEKVPIMVGEEFLRAYLDYSRKTNKNGRIVPSDESESGCRTSGTLNNWIEAVCKIANVTLPDGSYPTMQNFRQTWKTQYKEAVHLNRDEIKFVSEESGTNNFEVDESNYIDDVVNRDHIRDLGRKYFENLLPIDGFPKVVTETLEDRKYPGVQTDLTSW